MKAKSAASHVTSLNRNIQFANSVEKNELCFMTDSSRPHEKSYSYARSGAKVEPCPHPLSDLNESSSMNRMSLSPTPTDSPDSPQERQVVQKIDVEVQTELTGKDIDRLLKLEEDYRALQLNRSPSPLEEVKVKTTGRHDRLLLIGGATDSFSMKVMY